MKDHSAYDYAVHPYLTMRQEGSERYPYSLGVFWSRHGMVDVYSQPPLHKQHGITSLRFIHRQRVHCKGWDRRWPNRTIARLAREFADEVVGADA